MAAQLLHHFTPSEQITPSFLHHFTLLAAQLLHNFTPLWTNYPLTLTPLYPPWQPNSYIILPPGQITPSLLHHFTPLGSPTLTSFYPLRTNYPLILTPFYPPWQPNSYIILPPPNKLPPHAYTILLPLAAQLLAHFTPFWTIYPLTLTRFYPPCQPNSYLILPPLYKLPPHSYTILPGLTAQLLHHFTPSEQITPSFFHHFNPLAAQLLHHFTPWTNYPLTLTPFYPPWQPNSYLVLPPPNKIPLSFLHHFTRLGSPTLTSFYPLRTIYSLILTPFYPPWQPSSYIILHPSGQTTPSLLHHFTPLGSPTLTSFYPL